MSSDHPQPSNASSSISSTRRTFLRTTGVAALLTGASAAGGAAQSADAPSTPETAAGGPGRVGNLASYLEDPGVFEQGREPTHATAAVPYGSVERARDSDERFTALEERFAGSEYFLDLNGEWDFRFYERPADRPQEYADEDWDSIAVPSVWQTEGYDQYIYVNSTITWDAYDPPLSGELDPRAEGGVDVPDVNPTGTYRRTFSVPADWDGREVFLHFEGVKQAYFVWVDGEYVGYQQGPMTPGEFDVTEHVSAGSDHELTVQVYRFSDGEAMETIDMFRYAGIYRSVYLFAAPAVHVRDFHVRSGLDDDYGDGRLRVDAELANFTDESRGSYTVRAHLFEGEEPSGPGTSENAPRGSPDDPVTTLSTTASVGSDGATVTMETDVSAPAKWSAEHPNLYTLVLELVSPGGSPTEAMLDKVGFRTYETTRGEPGAHVLVNGEPVNVRGTNRHETDPDTGRTTPIETMRADLETMKRYNLNAVRTSHYPNDPTFLRLADEYGVYVQDEVCVESHWFENLLASTDAYHDQAVARFRRMLLRDRNHASIFSWSTGNEAGTGDEHLAMAALAADSPEHIPEDTSDVTGVGPVESYTGGVEGLAPDRLLYHQPNGGGWDVEYSDMLGPRYPDLDGLLSVADGSGIGDGERPVVMGEYNHAMGNSLGLVHRMWDGHIQPPVRRARDGIGEGPDGVLVGSPTVGVGREGGAVTLGGGDHLEIETTTGIDVSAPFTLAVSFRGIGPGSSRGILTTGERHGVAVDGGRLVVAAGGEPTVRKLPELSENEWHTVVLVSTDDGLRVYLDGERVATTGRPLGTFVGDCPLRLGDGPGDAPRCERSAGTPPDRSVTVDAVRAFDRALSAEEAADPASVEDGAVLRYTFDGLLRDRSLNGGFVWDWVNQDVTRTTTVDGEPVEYGFYDGNPFCLNGLVWSDRRTQPELEQLKHSHQPVKVAPTEDVADGEVYVTNHFSFTDLGALDGRWELVADDRTVDEGTLDLDLAPGETRRVAVPFELPEEPDPGAEYRLNVSFVDPEPSAYAEAGHRVARDQLEVPVDAPDAPTVDPADLHALSTAEGDGSIVVAGDGFEYTFDREAGTLSSMEYAGTELLADGPLFDAWRAPIMNEVQAWGSEQASSWREAGLDALTHQVDSVSVAQPEDALVEIDVDGFAQGRGPRTTLATPDATGGAEGTVHGDPDVVEGESGSALALDGEDDYVDAGTGAGVNFTDPGFTVGVTFRDPETGDHNPFVTKGDHQYGLKVNGDEFELFVYADGWHTVRAPVPDDLGDGWHTLTGVCAADELRLHLDGEQVGSSAYEPSTVDGSEFPVHVGHNAENTGRYTATTIDSVRIYDRALSADEVAAGFDSPPESAVRWYEFDEFEERQSSERGAGFRTTYRYRVYGSGDVTVAVEADPTDPLREVVTDYLPKVGLRLELPEAFSEFEWYGRGPTETYPDRKWGADVGRYSGSVADQYVPYLPPTDNGNKADTRWAALSNGDVGLLGAPTDGPANVNLEQWANLAEADHQHDLEPRGSVGFDLDHRVSGVGGTPVEPYDEYQVGVEPTAFEFRLRPFAVGEADPMDLAKRRFPADDG